MRRRRLFFKGRPYTGLAVYVNGFNGYESSSTDGVLCACIPTELDRNGSCWDAISHEPNILRDSKGFMVINRSLRGVRVDVVNGYAEGL